MGDQVGRCRLNFGSKLALPLHPSLSLLPLALAVAVLHPEHSFRQAIFFTLENVVERAQNRISDVVMTQ